MRHLSNNLRKYGQNLPKDNYKTVEYEELSKLRDSPWLRI